MNVLAVVYQHQIVIRNVKMSKTLETRKKNKGKGYFKQWPSYLKTLTGKPVGRPKKVKENE